MKPTKRAQLEAELAKERRKVYELKAQMASVLGTAFDDLPKAADAHGSAVIVTVTRLGGADVIPPVAIRDGLSRKTVEALQEDVCRSFELATMVNPAMARTSK